MTPRVFHVVSRRLLVVSTALFGVNYIWWRWTASVNWTHWWISVPLVVAETFTVVGSAVFGMTLWRPYRRSTPPPAAPDLAVDVFVMARDVPLELVTSTTRATQSLQYPHTTWIVDSRDRADLEAAAARLNVGYLPSTSTTDAVGLDGSGELANAMLWTDGEFVLVLDGAHVPRADFLDRTLGYFRDDQMALVQTPLSVANVPNGDPYAVRSPLLYGPVLAGKDGWNAAYFCGSNAIFRREAIMRVGVTDYAHSVEKRVVSTIAEASRLVRRARPGIVDAEPRIAAALEQIADAVHAAEEDIKRRRPLSETAYTLQNRVHTVARGMVLSDMEAIRADLAELAPDLDPAPAEVSILDRAAVEALVHHEFSPLAAITSIQSLAHAIDLEPGSAGPAPHATGSSEVTDQFTVSMRLHAAGWRSAYHREVLAHGQADWNLQSVINRRFAQDQGAMWALVRENPAFKHGLTVAQKLLYTATLGSCLTGFAAVIYFVAPAVYLGFGVLPITAYDSDYFLRLVPFAVLSIGQFLTVARGVSAWREQQFRMAMFPVRIRACVSVVRELVFGATANSPDQATRPQRYQWHLVRWQLVVLVMLATALVIGLVQLWRETLPIVAVSFNLIWTTLDLAILGVVIRAVRFQPGSAEFSSKGVT
ncbi:MAG: glycosyltransferase [Nocardiaceae bacterium]|nr:glycosyltransferase [Nocardiaceae bacterium]